MRMMQIVTLVSPDGAYGGPVRVALNQCTALRELGHDAQIAASSSGYDSTPHQADGVPMHLFPSHQVIPATGFAGLASPRLLNWARRHLHEFDVVHIHLARDLVTLPLARLAQLAGLPVVLQTHGMIDASSKLLARPLDRLLTVPALRRSQNIFYLTDTEARALRDLGGHDLPLTPLPNGVPLADVPRVSDGPLEVLYAARLHERKRPLLFAKAAVQLHRVHPNVRFTLDRARSRPRANGVRFH